MDSLKRSHRSSADGVSDSDRGEGTSSGAMAQESNGDAWTTVNSGSRKKQKKDKKRPIGQESHLEAIDRVLASGQAAIPLFHFDPAGFRNRQVTVADVRDMILNIVDKESHPRWLKINNKNAIRSVVCLLVQGIEPATIGLPSDIRDTMPQALEASRTTQLSKLPIFQRLFSHYCPTRAPGDNRRLHSVLQVLLNSTIPTDVRNKKKAASDKAAAAAGESDPALYLLAAEDFSESGYISPSYQFDPSSRLPASNSTGNKPTQTGVTIFPFEDWQREDGLIETPPILRSADEPTPRLRILGIDCEMCVTTAGSEVCRISVVDASGELVYNTLVKPANRIIDYATVYSGITEELLDPVETTLLDVQRKLATLIDFDTVLVGHSLNCDLVVLKLAHPWIIDTSVIYHHTRGPPFKASLKWLAEKWLKKEIQKPGKANMVETIGHNSEEDARAAVELVKLKMQRGLHFGQFATDQESIFERLARQKPKRKTCIIDHGKPAQWHGAKADTAIACSADAEITQGLVQHVKDHDFVFARFLDLSHATGWSKPSGSARDKALAATHKAAALSDEKTAVASGLDETGAGVTALDPEAAYQILNEQLATIHSALPANTAFVVLSGHGDPRALTALNAKKSRFDVLFKTGTPLSKMDPETIWTEADDRALTSAVARVRDGMTFLSIKR